MSGPPSDGIADTTPVMDGVRSPLAYIINGIAEEGGALAVNMDGRQWIVVAQFGWEAPDSPMVGGEAVGMAPLLSNALTQAAKDMGWIPDDTYACCDKFTPACAPPSTLRCSDCPNRQVPKS